MTDRAKKKGISGEPTLRKEPAKEMRQPMTRAVCEWHMGFSISAVRESQCETAQRSREILPLDKSSKLG